MIPQPSPLYTVGHSQRSLEELMALLAEADIRHLVDVRRYPVSKRHPHFSSDPLRAACEDAGLTYHWAGEQLGGYRAAAADSPHVALPEGLRGYADYMDSEPFARSVAQLIRLAQRATTAILCAERLPRDCHRQLIADFLWSQGVPVRHLIEAGLHEPHQLSACARQVKGWLRYDRLAQHSLPFEG